MALYVGWMDVVDLKTISDGYVKPYLKKIRDVRGYTFKGGMVSTSNKGGSNE